ncbi:hypothetical protein F9K94_17315 [Brucella tritici]|uniref:Glycoside hydrolase family 19 catalytic domain-containing protein n=1 Tax=Brucella tritici TaxID=94626 RepID=A0A7V7VSS8_9HYPH|nr:glycoside hydrolase family 19 protein [Brucella tritici]KAB2656262.1 hypothetical protein F9K94_17315 [Brucella tritici]
MNLNLGDTRLIIATAAKYGLLRNQLAYVLATAYHETAFTIKPVRETKANTDAKAKEILTKSWKAGKLPWVKADYWSSGFFGRGYVQLTHQENYQRAGQAIGVDLVANPSLALDQDIAAKIIVLGMKYGWFTGKKLSDFITLQKSEFVGARRIVNGTDKAGEIAGYASQYNTLLKAEGYGEAISQPVSLEPSTAPKVRPSVNAPPSTGFWAFMFAAIAALFGGGK